jgi:futalosine hydrolase
VSRKVNVSDNNAECTTFAHTNMNTLVIAATAKEIAPFLNYYRDNESLANTDVLITGIGLTAATYHLTRQLQLKKPQLVIQAGIAGCFNKNISLGTVFTIKQDAIADEGVTEQKKLRSIFDLGLANSNSHPFKKGLLINANTALIKKAGLQSVNSISINQVSTARVSIEHYHKKFKPVLESMEGAALHYVCLMEKVPFLQIRAVSNYIGERNKKKWQLKEAIINVNNELITLLEKL